MHIFVYICGIYTGIVAAPGAFATSAAPCGHEAATAPAAPLRRQPLQRLVCLLFVQRRSSGYSVESYQKADALGREEGGKD